MHGTVPAVRAILHAAKGNEDAVPLGIETQRVPIVFPGGVMIRVQVDNAKNRLDLIVDQQVNEGDMQRLLQELTVAVSSMQPGWLMVADYRGLAMVDPNLNPYIVQVQKTVRAAGPRKIAVILNDEVLQMQLRMGADMSKSNDITRRFTVEQEWLDYIAQP